jgi:hypothetical protein
MLQSYAHGSCHNDLRWNRLARNAASDARFNEPYRFYADSAFEAGAVNGGAYAMNKTIEIFASDVRDSRRTPQWEAIAMLFHPNWQACNEFARTAHARNTAIILGERCDKPVDCVICWTPGGAIAGGTGQALRIAAGYNIPVFNLFWPEHVSALWDWIGRI